MSQRVIIDYESIGMETIAQCEIAESTLERLKEKLKALKTEEAALLGTREKRLISHIEAEIKNIDTELNDVRSRAASTKKKGVNQDATGAQKHKAEQVLRDAQTLTDRSQSLSTESFYTVKAKVLKNLVTYAKEKSDSDGTSENRELNPEQLKRINAMDDALLREEVYDAWMNAPDASFEAIKKEAEASLQKTSEESLRANEEEIVSETMDTLASNKVDQETIDAIRRDAKDLKSLQTSANKEIADEKVRRQTIKAIVKIIKEQGFIVDKKNIKLRKDKNDVHILAQKASGEYAEFNIFLDGRFVYKFEGYEGQACQEDIEPFRDKLESIYNVEVKNETVTWSNPDKYQTRKKKTMKQNVNRR